MAHTGRETDVGLRRRDIRQGHRRQAGAPRSQPVLKPRRRCCIQEYRSSSDSVIVPEPAHATWARSTGVAALGRARIGRAPACGRRRRAVGRARDGTDSSTDDADHVEVAGTQRQGARRAREAVDDDGCGPGGRAEDRRTSDQRAAARRPSIVGRELGPSRPTCTSLRPSIAQGLTAQLEIVLRQDRQHAIEERADHGARGEDIEPHERDVTPRARRGACTSAPRVGRSRPATSGMNCDDPHRRRHGLGAGRRARPTWATGIGRHAPSPGEAVGEERLGPRPVHRRRARSGPAHAGTDQATMVPVDRLREGLGDQDHGAVSPPARARAWASRPPAAGRRCGAAAPRWRARRRASTWSARRTRRGTEVRGATSVLVRARLQRDARVVPGMVDAPRCESVGDPLGHLDAARARPPGPRRPRPQPPPPDRAGTAAPVRGSARGERFALVPVDGVVVPTLGLVRDLLRLERPRVPRRRRDTFVEQPLRQAARRRPSTVASGIPSTSAMSAQISSSDDTPSRQRQTSTPRRVEEVERWAASSTTIASSSTST